MYVYILMLVHSPAILKYADMFSVVKDIMNALECSSLGFIQLASTTLETGLLTPVESCLSPELHYCERISFLLLH